MAYKGEPGAQLPRGGYAKRDRTQVSILDAALAEASERGNCGSRAELPRAMMRAELYRQGITAWVELLSERLRDGIANGSVRPMDDAEIVDAYLALIRHALKAPSKDADRG
jgi:hypothetical protein